MKNSTQIQTETTDAGQQALVPGVAPVSTRKRLEILAALPLLPERPQKPCDIGLFDDVARAQLDLFTPRR